MLRIPVDELKMHPLQFKSCYRMRSDTFQKLFEFNLKRTILNEITHNMY